MEANPGHAGPGSRRARRRGDVKRDQVRRRRDAESAALQRSNSTSAGSRACPGRCTAVGRLVERFDRIAVEGFTDRAGHRLGEHRDPDARQRRRGQRDRDGHHNQQLFTRRGWCSGRDVQGCQLTEPAGSPRDPVRREWQWLRDLHGSGLPDVGPVVGGALQEGSWTTGVTPGYVRFRMSGSSYVIESSPDGVTWSGATHGSTPRGHRHDGDEAALPGKRL